MKSITITTYNEITFKRIEGVFEFILHNPSLRYCIFDNDNQGSDPNEYESLTGLMLGLCESSIKNNPHKIYIGIDPDSNSAVITMVCKKWEQSILTKF